MSTAEITLNTDSLTEGFTQREIDSAVEGMVNTLRNHDHLKLAGPVTVTYNAPAKVFTFEADLIPSEDYPQTSFGYAARVDFS